MQPSPHSPTYIALCAAIGHIVVNWSNAEQTLDLCVTIVFRFCGGNKLQKELPRSLSRKLQFMRDAFRKLDPLKPFAASGLQTIDEMDTLSDTRHEMVHGALVGRLRGTDRWHFQKFDYGTDIHAIRDVVFTTDDFRDFGKRTLDLGAGLLIFSNRLKRLAPRPK